MALLALEGFDDGLAALRWPEQIGSINTTYGYGGTKGLLVGDTSNGALFMQVDAMTDDLTLTVGFRVQIKDHGTTTGGYYFVAGFSYSSSTMSTYFHVAVTVNPTTGA